MLENRLQQGTRVTRQSIWINVILTIAKFVAGLVANSSAMVADAIHSGSDIITSVAVLVGLRLGSKPADATHPYGHGRLESVAAKIVASLLILTALGLIYNSGRILINNEASAPGILAAYAAIASIIVKEWLYRYTMAVGQRINSTAIMADAWHHRSDAFSSIGTLAGIIGARLAFPWLDPLAGLIVAVIVLKVGIELYLQSIDELIDSAPGQEVIDAIRHTALGQTGVLNVDELKARKFGPGIQVDLKISVDPYTTVENSHMIAHKVEESIIANVAKVEAVMVHVNPWQDSPDH